MNPNACIAETNTIDREAAIMEHLPQVRLIARKIHDRLPSTVSLDDLISSGTVGLIAAIDRYDSSLGLKLRTYAEYKIRGAILDSLREMDWAPRSQRRRARQIQQAISAVEQRGMRAPSQAEVAQELGISVEECREWMAESRSMSIGSLETGSQDDEGRDLMRQIADTTEDSLPSRSMEREQLRRLIAQALERMPVNERTILNLYYHENLTLREIAKVLGVHESRVSQLKIQALGRLRTLLERQWPQRGTKVKPNATVVRH